MSVILWKVINTGANKVFISTLIHSATKTLPQLKSALNHSAALPSRWKPPSSRARVPVLKMVMAEAMTTPNTPHTNILGNKPKPFLRYTPSRIRKANISPKVPRMANLKKLINSPWFLVVSLNQSHAPGIKANPHTTAATTIKVTTSDFFI